jgi:hypothetical protein
MARDTPSHEYTPTYQISLIYLKRQKGYDSHTKTLQKYKLFIAPSPLLSVRAITFLSLQIG